MSALQLPVLRHDMTQAKPVIVDTDYSGLVHLDLGQVTGVEDSYVSLTPGQARALAAALTFFAEEADR